MITPNKNYFFGMIRVNWAGWGQVVRSDEFLFKAKWRIITDKGIICHRPWFSKYCCQRYTILSTILSQEKSLHKQKMADNWISWDFRWVVTSCLTHKLIGNTTYERGWIWKLRLNVVWCGLFPTLEWIACWHGILSTVS